MISDIWEGLRPLPFFSFAPPPHPRPYDGPCFCRTSAPSVPPGRAAWPAPPSRPGAIAPRRVPCGGLVAVLGTKKECGGMKIARLARAAPRRALAPGGWWSSGPGGVGPGPSWAVAGLPRSVFAAARSAGGAAPPARLKAVLGAGPAGLCGPPAVRFGRSPPWRLCGRWGVPAAPGGAGSPWPAPARPRLGGCNWLAGAPPAPRRRGWARPPCRGPRCGSLWPGPVPPPFRPALLQSRPATVEEGSALPGARGFRRCGGGERPGGKAPGGKVRGGVYVAKNTLRGESVSKWAKSPFGRAGRSEILLSKKGIALF